jgi:hypothetical protein
MKTEIETRMDLELNIKEFKLTPNQNQKELQAMQLSLAPEVALLGSLLCGLF